MVRTYLVPPVFSRAVRFRAVARFMFRTISQIRIQYHDSLLSGRSLGELRAGDRLPWLKYCDNFAPLSSLDWQIHIYGNATEKTVPAGLAVHEFPWHQEADDKGFLNGVAYLIRPDGYIASISALGNIAAPW